MTTVADTPRKINWHKVQQIVKWTVYVLLLVNWGYYIFEDANRAYHTLTPDASPLKIAGEFATSIDVAAWFVLLFMFELETYILGDDDWKGWVAKTVRGLRLLCFAMIAHTVYANANALSENLSSVAWGNIDHLCDLSDGDVSYVYNLEYTEVTGETCEQLPKAEQYFQVGVDPVIATHEGLILERNLAWTDLLESIVWVLIILAIEVVIRLQDRNVTGSTLMTVANRSKIGLYLCIGLAAAYWASLGHWVYAWDEFLWVAGFGAIELNVSEWRDEILENRDGAEPLREAI